MKVQDLRDRIKGVDRENLEKAFSESYKRFTKAQKEDVDQIINEIFAEDEMNNSNSFEILEQEIETFLENVYKKNYLIPNEVIEKSQRPRWRFVVKKYLKQLQKITIDDPCYDRSVILFRKLYEMLCQACDCYLFSTEDTFRSMGWSQTRVYQILTDKVFQAGYTRENIKIMMDLATTGGLSNKSFYLAQSGVLASALKTTDVKELAIEEIEKAVIKCKRELIELKRCNSKTDSVEQHINNLCDLYLLIKISLSELKKGLIYYFDNFKKKDSEIILYRALRVCAYIGDRKIWLQTYEYGIKKNIEPRSQLVHQYDNLSF